MAAPEESFDPQLRGDRCWLPSGRSRAPTTSVSRSVSCARPSKPSYIEEQSKPGGPRDSRHSTYSLPPFQASFDKIIPRSALSRRARRFLAAISTEIANNGGTSAAITNLDLMDGLSYQSAGKLDPAAKILRPNRRRIGPEFDRDLFAIGSLARHRRKRGQRLIALAHEIRSRPEQQMAKRGGSVQATG
jgi:hypothetical protein